MIDISKAICKEFIGVSFWECGDGNVQCNLKRRNGGSFAVGVGRSIEEAWEVAWRVSGAKTSKEAWAASVKKSVRNDEDLL